MTTYSRQRPRAQEYPDLEGPRKRIRMSATGAVIEETLHPASPAPAPPSEPPKPSEHERSSVSVPSSPVSSGPKLFSDDLQADSESDLSSAPDSPPKALPLGSLASHKPAFAFLKRRRIALDDAPSRGRKRPLDEIDANASKRPKPSHGKSFTQLQIDLGDVVQKECKGCGMEYVPSNSEDAALHKEYHDLNVSGVDLGKNFAKHQGVRAVYTNMGLLHEDEAVLAVDKECLPKTRSKVRKMLELVNAELSAKDIDEEVLWSAARSVEQARDSRKGTKDPADDGGARFKAFLLMSGEKCIGFCLAQKIKSAHAVVSSSSATDTTEDALAGSSGSSISVSRKPSVALLGISRIWTSRKFRGRGLSGILLDCARGNFFYGLEVPKELTAFSQPTESGGKLARKWYGKAHGWLVYQADQGGHGSGLG